MSSKSVIVIILSYNRLLGILRENDVNSRVFTSNSIASTSNATGGLRLLGNLTGDINETPVDSGGGVSSSKRVTSVESAASRLRLLSHPTGDINETPDGSGR